MSDLRIYRSGKRPLNWRRERSSAADRSWWIDWRWLMDDIGSAGEYGGPSFANASPREPRPGLPITSLRDEKNRIQPPNVKLRANQKIRLQFTVFSLQRRKECLTQGREGAKKIIIFIYHSVPTSFRIQNSEDMKPRRTRR